MIQRLNKDQTIQVIRDLAPAFTQFRVPEPITEAAVLAYCGNVAESEIGRCYGMFDDELRPQGLFVGMVMPHPETGLKVGIEHHWWMIPGARGGRALLDRFEEDCRAEGCTRVICGYSEFANPERLKKIYTQRGYAPYSTSMSKEL